MTQPNNRILKKMLDRLFASLVNGPSLNCRPQSSRQRIDLIQLAKLGDRTPDEILRAFLGPDRRVTVSARVPTPKFRYALGRAVSGQDEQTREEQLRRVSFVVR